ncbi:hypothetical protein [Nonomuraea sp. bgisy101]|uniref:hypothetical protein n=1 Tax=Nonomuraea sp. bgisy101 TaxID=3413784 RepID=UPI003D719A01
MNLFDVLREPPRSHSPAAIWWWSGEPLRRDRLRWQMRRLVDGGVHHLVVLNLAPSGPLFGADADDPPFLSEEWWELFDGVCEDALGLGAFLWFYDQLGFSGADLQARLVQEHPEFAGQWLAADGTVTTRGFDYLSRTACEVLLDRVHGEFERRLGHWFGRVIVGSFQDELPSMPTWSGAFAAEFRARRGQEFRLEDPDWHAYHRTRAELAEEAFFRPLAEWHAKHGLLNGCDQQDPARAGHPVEGVELYADYTRTHRWFSAPGSDHHGDARLHSSLAHLYGRPRTWIEAFHSSGWGGTLEETLDWLLPWLRAGANLYNPHAVYYTTKAGWWEWAPPSTDWRQPYWRHHRVFADAVTRMCAALSLGRHVCDIAVLFPTTTAQAGTPLPGGSAGERQDAAVRAQRVYRRLVGDMAWFGTVPGVLDRLCLDADVIDEDSVERAVAEDGRLAVSGEAYRVVILPAVTELDEQTAGRLGAFVDGGGLLVAVGALPRSPVLRARFSEDPAARPAQKGRARFVASEDELGAALAGFEPQVEAEVPPLVREVDGVTLVFLTAASPRASRIAVGRPEERGVELGWLDATIDFDPRRYRDRTRVKVRGVSGTPLLAGPFGGEPRALPYTIVDGAVEVVVPFDEGPAAMLLFTGEDLPVAPPREPYPHEVDLGGDWAVELVPTMDDTWGDFATSATVERWTLTTPEGEPVHATFGPHGEQRTGDGSGLDWRPSIWSESRGLRKDPIHRDTLGPKGHVPEEFIDFGRVAAGQSGWFRTLLAVPPAARDVWLVVGAAAAKTVWLDGVELPLDDAGHLAVGPLPPAGGERLLEVRLVPDEDLGLRAHVSVTADPARVRRPEWIVGPVLETVVESTGEAAGGVLQVASTAPCLVLVNGREAGRQGGFDPYAEADIPRVRRYDLRPLLRPGPNTIRLECAGAVLADGLAVSGPGWTGPGGGEGPLVRRRQHGDPAALHLRPRQHPLPGAGWIDGRDTALPAVFAAPGSRRPREERFVVDIPPGAVRVDADTHGPARILVDGVEKDLPAALDGSARSAELRVAARPGFEGGGALAGPVRFDCGPGRMTLGAWESYGLADYSGGVRYTTTVRSTSPTPAVLDLGGVRGTAEVTVDGVAAGVRICAPYTFDLSLTRGENRIEILVLGTLAPYLDAVSPTHFVFPGQRVTGLFGPVTLRTAHPLEEPA